MGNPKSNQDPDDSWAESSKGSASIHMNADEARQANDRKMDKYFVPKTPFSPGKGDMSIPVRNNVALGGNSNHPPSPASATLNPAQAAQKAEMGHFANKEAADNLSQADKEQAIAAALKHNRQQRNHSGKILSESKSDFRKGLRPIAQKHHEEAYRTLQNT